MSLTFLGVSDVFVASDELDVSDELSVLMVLECSQCVNRFGLVPRKIG
jgi:hypothetical protein